MSSGGLHIPEQARDRPQQGVVLAAGPDAKQLQAGDLVLYGRYAGSLVTLNERELLILRQADVLAVLEGEEIALAPAEELAGPPGIGVLPGPEDAELHQG